MEEFIERIKDLIYLKTTGNIKSSFKNFDILLKKFSYDENLKNFKTLLISNLTSSLDLFETIRLVTDLNYDFYKKNFILSGLNLAFLGHYVTKETKIINNLYHWPDGLFKFIFFKKDTKKILVEI